MPLFTLVTLVVKIDDVADGLHSEVFEVEKFFRMLVAFFFDAVVLGIVTWEGINSTILTLVYHSSHVK